MAELPHNPVHLKWKH